MHRRGRHPGCETALAEEAPTRAGAQDEVGELLRLRLRKPRTEPTREIAVVVVVVARIAEESATEGRRRR